MTITARPDAVSRYLDAERQRDIDAMVGCFAPDATVTDEGRTRRGRAEIRQWREELAGTLSYTITVLGRRDHAPELSSVPVRVAGDFPGSPVRLTFRFTTQQDLITELHIAP
ncbi:nuclear transport factor 2 family protein [Catellatospora paridis]|uniref:nuclear transport factor 2 family protein n=1 Tax=Catellatospora paridis TaxID=1617086 RepID=UPI0012D43BB6|nr:nuclear transport factor 2 family protein [Catellatospora paridis]